MLYVDKGLNDAWVRPEHVRQTAPGQYTIALQEPLGRDWDRQIVRYALPGAEAGVPVTVTCAGSPVPCQWDNDRLALLADRLRAREERLYEVTLGTAPAPEPGVTVRETAEGVELDNGPIALLLPASSAEGLASPLPGPLLAVRRSEGSWRARGRLEAQAVCTGLTSEVTAAGQLWTTVTSR